MSSRSPSALPCQGRRLACQGRGGAPPSPSLPWLFGLFLIRGRGRGRLRLRLRLRVRLRVRLRLRLRRRLYAYA